MDRLTSQDALADYLAHAGDLMFARIDGLTVAGGLPDSVAQATFTGCRFLPGIRVPSDLSEALFVECQLADLEFTAVNLYAARFIRCDLTGSRFVDCNMAALEVVDCRVQSVSLQRCDLDGASLGSLAIAGSTVSCPTIDAAA